MTRISFTMRLQLAALVISFSAISHARAETDDSVLRGRIRELRDAVQRCQTKIADKKLEKCEVRTRWNNQVVSMSEALDIANELEPREGNWEKDYTIAIENMSCRTLYRCVPRGTDTVSG